jgi:chemotaxis protein CheD
VKATRIYLQPGELYAADAPAVVSTVLGSCIAVTFFSPRTGMGSICHALLPRNPAGHGVATFRYVDSSVLHMVGQFDAMGIPRDEVEVKVLGGADVLEGLNGTAVSVGRQNIEAAFRIIEQERLSVAVTDVGGSIGRKIYFCTHTGKVLLKRLKVIGVQP